MNVIKRAWSGAIFSRMLRRVRAAKRFKDAFAPVCGEMDVQFTYVLDHEMDATEVRVRRHSVEGKDSYWVLIKRVSPTVAQ